MTGPDRWQISYADLLTLLLGFFIVMYAVTSMEADKKHDIIEALRSEFGSQAATPQNPQIATPDWALLQDYGFSVEQSGEWLYLEATSELLFDSGQASIKPKAEQALNAVAQWLATTYGPIEIEGHTDNLPINTAIFPSNWALSSARAVAIVDYLMNKTDLGGQTLEGARFSAVGMGEFSPIADNATAEGRRKNRRVIIKARAGGALPSIIPPFLAAPPTQGEPSISNAAPNSQRDGEATSNQRDAPAENTSTTGKIDALKQQLKANGIEAQRTNNGGLKFTNGE